MRMQYMKRRGARGQFAKLSHVKPSCRPYRWNERSYNVLPRRRHRCHQDFRADDEYVGKVNFLMVAESVLIISAVLLVVVAIACWASNVIGLPGNWLVVAFAAMFSYFVPDDRRLDISVMTVLGLFALAAIGEAIEFLAGALGASKAGASKRGSALALLGSIIGGIAGIFLPLPVVGPIVGAGLGALVGAVLGEQWKGRDLDESLSIGHAAFWGRIVGTLGKILVGCVMLVMLVASLLSM